MHRFKRKAVDTDAYLRQLVVYIHQNPILHGFVRHPDEWKYSSHNVYLSGDNSDIDIFTMLTYFGDRDNFQFCHNKGLMDLDDQFSLE